MDWGIATGCNSAPAAGTAGAWDFEAALAFAGAAPLVFTLEAAGRTCRLAATAPLVMHRNRKEVFMCARFITSRV